MMAEGTLPEGYTVKKRKLVKVDAAGQATKKNTKGKKKKKKKPTKASGPLAA